MVISPAIETNISFFNTIKLNECSLCKHKKSNSMICCSLHIFHGQLKNKMTGDLNYAELMISNNGLVATLIIKTLFL